MFKTAARNIIILAASLDENFIALSILTSTIKRGIVYDGVIKE